MYFFKSGKVLHEVSLMNPVNLLTISLLSILQEGNGDNSNWTKLYDLEEPQSRTVSPQNLAMGFMPAPNQEGESKAEEKQEFQNRDGMKILPFEFVALEACLEAACGVLENEVFISSLLL